jgi:leucyl-tRNA synthetase
VPIPVIFCDDCGIQLEQNLPLILPDVSNDIEVLHKC